MNTSTREIKSVFQDNYTSLCIFAYSYVLDKDNAKDVVQDVFVKLLEADSLAHINNLEAYIKTSVYHSCLKFLKQNAVTDSLTKAEERLASKNLSQESQLIKEEESVLVLKELNLLPSE